MAQAETAPSRNQIGPYQIIARVGAGGMGVVFKAWDPRLERDVAIKVLHPETAGDADRQKRLLAEGRAASALNHPNILRVYDAALDGSSYYLVSEWLEGKSLRDELARGGLPLKRLLDLAVQIADGLAAAHAMGIVHRDIKPENVMLARDGTARIVDFGLARSSALAPGASTVDGHAPTITASLEGGVSGTPAYMSPEQARGTAGDFRTDQFSFGALLYEMATGKHAFRRDTLADTLSAVLNEEPRPIADVNQRIPAPVRWTIERCLTKDHADRYSATDDLARELRWLRDRLTEALSEPRSELAPTVKPRWRSRLALMSAAVLAAVVTAMIVGDSADEQPSPKFIPFASASEYEGEPSWAPDGQSLAYAADVDGVLQVFVKRVGDALARQLTRGQFDASAPFWSQDGQRIYYIGLAGDVDSLWSVGVAGGRPELAIENVASAAIDPDGSRLALLRQDAEAELRQTLWWSSPPGAEPTRELRAPFDRLRNGGDTALRFSRDGQLLVWIYDVDTASPTERPQPSTFHVIPKASAQPRSILASLGALTNLSPFAWWPDNRRVVVALPDTIGNRHLWLADSHSGAIRQITSGHSSETEPAVDPTGARIAYASQEIDFDLTLITPDGRSRRTMLATARNEFDPAWSPKGDQYAFVTDRSGTLEIWARSRDGVWERPVVSASDFPDSRTDTLGSLAYSPNGTLLAYQRSSGGTWDIWMSPSSGGKPVRLLSAGTSTDRPWRDAATWSPDSEWIAYISNVAGEARLSKTRVGGNETVDLIKGVLLFSRPAWSPDGRWIVTQTADGLVRVPADGGPAQLLTTTSVLSVTWRTNSRHVVTLTESDTPGHFGMVEIDAANGDERVLNPDLGPVPIASQPIRGFSLLASEGFLTSLASARSDIWLIEDFRPRRSLLDRLFSR